MRVLACSCCFVFFSCTATEIDFPVETPEEGKNVCTLSVNTLSLGENTKAVYEDIGTDKAANHLESIGVLVTRGSDPKEYYSSLVKKQIFTCNDNADKKIWTTVTPLNLDNVDGTVYAWAPSDMEGKLDGNSQAVPILCDPVILSDQSFAYGNEWETNQTDYLYGTAADKTAPVVNRLNSSVTLSMQHALAKISFRVMKAKGQAVTVEDYVKRIELTSDQSEFATSPDPATGVALRLTDGILTGTTPAKSLMLTAAMGKQGQLAEWSETDEGVQDFAQITFPQVYGLGAPADCSPTPEVAGSVFSLWPLVRYQAGSGGIGVKITLGPAGALDTDKDHTYQTANNTTVAANWEQGKHYVYTMSVTDRGIEFIQVQVIGWDDTPPTVNVPVE